jgi:TnpA family transposase
VTFIKNAWKRYVFTEDGSIDRRYYELCLFTQLRDRLRAGEISVIGSRQYKDFDQYLLPQARYAEMKAAGTLPVSVPVDFAAYIAERKERLTERIAEVSDKLEAGTLKDVRLRDGLIAITPLKRVEPPEAPPIRRLVADTLPRIKITDLVMEVDAWTSFSKEFVDIRTGEAAADKTLLYTGVLADGLNFGLTRMADACPGISVSRLYWMSQWHIREETYARALAQVIDHHHRLPFSRHFGDGSTSSSDGQYFRAGGRGEAQSNVNAHYGDDPGVKFYTHISDQGGPYHVKVISTTGSEAPHVIDGLRHHESELRIKEHYTDTGGVSEHVFALCHLLGYRFVPRIRNLKDRGLFTFRKASAYPVLERQIGGQLNERHMEAHWDEVLRLVASIETGTVTASQIMRKLASYPRQNGLAIALREIGRLERTFFTLDWIEDPHLRRRNLMMLNLGESCNSLKRAVFIHRLGELRDRTLENQLYRANGLNLVVAAIILWNTVYIERAVGELRQRGHRIPDELLPSLSPLIWEHINLTGDYVWNYDRGIGREFRPLRVRPQYRIAA